MCAIYIMLQLKQRSVGLRVTAAMATCDLCLEAIEGPDSAVISRGCGHIAHTSCASLLLSDDDADKCSICALQGSTDKMNVGWTAAFPSKLAPPSCAPPGHEEDKATCDVTSNSECVVDDAAASSVATPVLPKPPALKVFGGAKIDSLCDGQKFSVRMPCALRGGEYAASNLVIKSKKSRNI